MVILAFHNISTSSRDENIYELQMKQKDDCTLLIHYVLQAIPMNHNGTMKHQKLNNGVERDVIFSSTTIIV